MATRCPACNIPLGLFPPRAATAHVNECLDKHATSSNARVSPADEDEISTRPTTDCPICGKDISGMSTSAQLAHANRCADNTVTRRSRTISRQTSNVRIDWPVIPSTTGNRKKERNNIESIDHLHPPLRNLLELTGLSRYAKRFARHEIELDMLKELTDEEWMEIGLPQSARRKIQQALMGATLLDVSHKADSGIPASLAMESVNVCLSKDGNKSGGEDQEQSEMTQSLGTSTLAERMRRDRGLLSELFDDDSEEDGMDRQGVMMNERTSSAVPEFGREGGNKYGEEQDSGTGNCSERGRIPHSGGFTQLDGVLDEFAEYGFCETVGGGSSSAPAGLEGGTVARDGDKTRVADRVSVMADGALERTVSVETRERPRGGSSDVGDGSQTVAGRKPALANDVLCRAEAVTSGPEDVVDVPRGTDHVPCSSSPEEVRALADPGRLDGVGDAWSPDVSSPDPETAVVSRNDGADRTLGLCTADSKPAIDAWLREREREEVERHARRMRAIRAEHARAVRMLSSSLSPSAGAAGVPRKRSRSPEPVVRSRKEQCTTPSNEPRSGVAVETVHGSSQDMSAKEQVEECVDSFSSSPDKHAESVRDNDSPTVRRHREVCPSEPPIEKQDRERRASSIARQPLTSLLNTIENNTRGVPLDSALADIGASSSDSESSFLDLTQGCDDTERDAFKTFANYTDSRPVNEQNQQERLVSREDEGVDSGGSFLDLTQSDREVVTRAETRDHQRTTNRTRTTRLPRAQEHDVVAAIRGVPPLYDQMLMGEVVSLDAVAQAVRAAGFRVTLKAVSELLDKHGVSFGAPPSATTEQQAQYLRTLNSQE